MRPILTHFGLIIKAGSTFIEALLPYLAVHISSTAGRLQIQNLTSWHPRKITVQLTEPQTLQAFRCFIFRNTLPFRPSLCK